MLSYIINPPHLCLTFYTNTNYNLRNNSIWVHSHLVAAACERQGLRDVTGKVRMHPISVVSYLHMS